MLIHIQLFATVFAIMPVGKPETAKTAARFFEDAGRWVIGRGQTQTTVSGKAKHPRSSAQIRDVLPSRTFDDRCESPRSSNVREDEMDIIRKVLVLGKWQ
jgi:hypothetical protein